MTTLLGISGSLRKASTNTMLMRNAAEIFGPDSYFEGDIRFPLYDGDLEEAEGIPAAVQMLADQIAAARLTSFQVIDHGETGIQQGHVRRAEKRARLG